MSSAFNALKPDEPIKGKLSWRDNRQKYMAEKSKGLKLPTPEVAELKPSFMFEEPTFIVHMCFECRKLNRTLEVVKVNNEYQQFPLALCKICSANFNIQRRSKFFNHDLLIFKKENDKKSSAMDQ